MTAARARRLLRLWRVLLACVVVAFAARPAPASVVVDTVVLVASERGGDAAPVGATSPARRVAVGAPRLDGLDVPGSERRLATARPPFDHATALRPDRPLFLLHRALLC